MKKTLKVPKFKNGEQERVFWSKINLADYFKPVDFEPVSFPIDDIKNRLDIVGEVFNA